jgi:hypothetical protein
VDSKGIPIRSWVNYVTTEWVYEEARKRGTGANGKSAHGSSQNATWSKIKTLEAAIDKHHANGGSVYFKKACTQADRDELKAMRKRLAELQEQSAKEAMA